MLSNIAVELERRRARVLRVTAAFAGNPPPSIAVAIAHPRIRAWALIAARRARVAAVVVADRAELFGLLADHAVAAVIAGDTFDGVATEQLIAFVRAAGCRVPAVVTSADPSDALMARAARLAPIELLVAPCPHTADAPRTRWLERCVELALGARQVAG